MQFWVTLCYVNHVESVASLFVRKLMNWGWGYHANPETHCGFTMPASTVSINAEFQLP